MAGLMHTAIRYSGNASMSRPPTAACWRTVSELDSWLSGAPRLRAVAALGLGFAGGWFLTRDRHENDISRYCAYGAVSKAQLRGCESHVTEKQIAMLNTNAALFARHKLTVCLEDAGRSCPAATVPRTSAVTHGAPKPGPGGFGDTPNGGFGGSPNGGFGSGGGFGFGGGLKSGGGFRD